MRIKLLIAAVTLSLLSACVTNVSDEVFNQDSPAMQDVFYGVEDKSGATGNDTYGFSDGRTSRFSRNPDNELEQLFRELPNKRIKVFVFPHLSSDYPVPGYTTAIHLYEKAQNYALPGER